MQDPHGTDPVSSAHPTTSHQVSATTTNPSPSLQRSPSLGAVPHQHPGVPTEIATGCQQPANFENCLPAWLLEEIFPSSSRQNPINDDVVPSHPPIPPPPSFPLPEQRNFNVLHVTPAIAAAIASSGLYYIPHPPLPGVAPCIKSILLPELHYTDWRSTHQGPEEFPTAFHAPEFVKVYNYPGQVTDLPDYYVHRFYRSIKSMSMDVKIQEVLIGPNNYYVHPGSVSQQHPSLKADHQPVPTEIASGFYPDNNAQHLPFSVAEETLPSVSWQNPINNDAVPSIPPIPPPPFPLPEQRTFRYVLHVSQASASSGQYSIPQPPRLGFAPCIRSILLPELYFTDRRQWPERLPTAFHAPQFVKVYYPGEVTDLPDYYVHQFYRSIKFMSMTPRPLNSYVKIQEVWVGPNNYYLNRHRC